jgi:hypothetical protein
MNRFRFSIGSLLVVLTLLGCGLAAMVSQSLWATSLVYTAFLALICLAAAGAMLAAMPQRAFWLGLAIFGWTYWFVEFDASGISSRPTASVPVVLGLGGPQPTPQPRAGLLTSELMTLLEEGMTTHRQVGSKVIAQWRGGSYYSGTITQAQNGQYLIVWDDGSAPQWTAPSQIQPNSPNLRIAAHATLGGLFALVGGSIVAVLFGGRASDRGPKDSGQATAPAAGTKSARPTDAAADRPRDRPQA